MIKTIRKVIVSCLSILGISFLCWVILFLNPSLTYANKTQVGQVTIFHDQDLDENATHVVTNAIERIKKSELYEKDYNIELCHNDNQFYTNLNLLVKYGLAYATMNKTIMKRCDVKFDQNVAETRWPINEYEFRQFDLTYLIAHEFTHNLQYNKGYMPKTISVVVDWRLEGYADYIGRAYMNDGLLKNRMDQFLAVENNKHIGFPVFDLDDGTKQILSYHKYAMVVQYLIEVKGMSFDEIYKQVPNIDEPYAELLKWSQS